MRRLRPSTWTLLGIAGALCLALCSSADRISTASVRDVPQTQRLAGLPFRAFVDEAFLLVIEQFPQSVSYHGLADRLGMRNDTLDDHSEASRQRTSQLLHAIAEQSRSYDRERLSFDEQITYDAWMNYLEWMELGQSLDRLSLAECLDPLCVELRLALTAYHPWRSVADVDDYLARLEGVGAQLDQILGILELAVSKGQCPPQRVVVAPVSELVALKNRHIGSHILYRPLLKELSNIPTIDLAKRKKYRERASKILSRDVIPAAERFCRRLVELSASAPVEAGMSAYEGGASYYEDALQRTLGWAVSCREVHELAVAEAERRRAEYLLTARTLSLPAEEGVYAVIAAVVRRAGWVKGDREITERYGEIIDEVRGAVSGAFVSVPQDPIRVTVSNDELTAYAAGTLDASRPAQFLCSYFGEEACCLMRATVCHEVIPGHHLQRATASGTPLPLVQQTVKQPGFTEGGATYAQRSATESGAYVGDPVGLMGQLWLDLRIAVDAVIDTGIHGLGWSLSQAAEYVAGVLDAPSETVWDSVEAVATAPLESVPYFAGEMKLLELRFEVQEALGDCFDLAEFHEVLLGHGSVPLSALERVIQAYIDRVSDRSEPLSVGAAFWTSSAL